MELGQYEGNEKSLNAILSGVITQNIPKVVKGNLKVTAKNTFRKKLAFLSREGSLKYKFNKARYWSQ